MRSRPSRSVRRLGYGGTRSTNKTTRTTKVGAASLIQDSRKLVKRAIFRIAAMSNVDNLGS